MLKEKFRAMIKNQIVYVIIILLTSCDVNRIYENNKEIKSGIWNVHDTITFDVDLQDTITPLNFYINIRNGGMYPYANLYMFVTTLFPNGETHRDTVECILADSKGWLGSGLGDIWDNQILYRRGVRIPIPGKYVFSYEQAQRSGELPYIENLPFIMDVGLRIEKQNE